jgi:F-type H+-transporting ATPase subunit b
MFAELLQDAHFWVGVAFAILVGIAIAAGVPGTITKLLDARGLAVQAQLDEATKLREEAQALLAQIQTQRADSERLSAEMLSNAQAEAKRLGAEAKDRLAEQIQRRGELAERKIATAEAQAAADVKAAAADLAAQMAEQVLAARAAGAKSDPLIDAALGQMASKLQ